MPLSAIPRITDRFGWDGFPDALFYHADHALRFELGDGVEATVERSCRL